MKRSSDFKTTCPYDFKVDDLVKYTNSKGEESIVIVMSEPFKWYGGESGWEIEAMFPNGHVFSLPVGTCVHV